MTDLTGTQIGPDGKRHDIEDLPDVTKPVSGRSVGQQATLLESASRSDDASGPPVFVGDRTDARLDLNVTALGGTNEVQTVTLNNATGGTFTLTFSGQTTAAIPYNATAAAVQSALEALSNIGVGDVVVAGSAGGPYTITFQGALGSTNVAQLTSSAASLTSGSTATISHATTTPGVAPTLDVTIETAPEEDGTYTSVGTFSQASTVSTQHKVFSDLDEWVRVTWATNNGSVTFDVEGELI